MIVESEEKVDFSVNGQGIGDNTNKKSDANVTLNRTAKESSQRTSIKNKNV
jgi:hypothetical protein